MPILLQAVQAGSPRRADEGLRIGTVRFLPRGVRRQDYARLDYFDVWLPVVAPSRELLGRLKRSKISFQAFAKSYRREMQETDPRQTIALLAALARRTAISICCYCEDESRCHRLLLTELIRKAACEQRSRSQ